MPPSATVVTDVLTPLLLTVVSVVGVTDPRILKVVWSPVKVLPALSVAVACTK